MKEIINLRQSFWMHLTHFMMDYHQWLERMLLSNWRHLIKSYGMVCCAFFFFQFHCCSLIVS